MCMSVAMLSHEYDCLANIGTKELGQMSNSKGKMWQLKREKYMKKHTKTHRLLQILAVSVIGKYGTHLMTVMIFVTQNNF